MHKYIILFLFLFLSSTANSQVPKPKNAILHEYPKIDTTGLVWNKWDTKNFIILSLDKNQGYEIYNKIENIKNKVLFRWGIQNFNFKIKCKVVCVPDAKTLNGFFRIDKSYSEFSKDKNGIVDSCSIWLNLEDFNSLEKEINKLILLQLDEFSWWTKRGMILLNENFDEIKSNIVKYTMDLSNLKNIDENKWKEKSDIDKKNFDNNSMLMCLFIRKEFGQNIFKNFVRSQQSEKDIREILGFDSAQDFDKTFKRYVESIHKDVINSKIPDSYLEIKGVK
jgi:hypothetical protein